MYFKSDTRHERAVPKLLAKAAKATLLNLSSPFVSPISNQCSFVFIVGRGHSGTTLLAGKLGRLDEVFLVGRESRIFAPENGLQTAKVVAKEWCFFAESLGKTTVLEKTPKHVHCVRRIWRVIPTAKVIAVIRNPLDNIASLNTRFSDLNFARERWMVDNTAVLRISEDPRVKLIKYEQLVAEPETVFKTICRFTNLTYSPDILPSGATPFSLYKSNKNQTLRTGQVARPIGKRIDVWGGVRPRDDVINRDTPPRTDRSSPRTAPSDRRYGKARAGSARCRRPCASSACLRRTSAA